MSDDGDSNGKPSGHGHWQGGRKSTADSANIPAVLLALAGAAIVAIQTYIFIAFNDDADTYDFFLPCNATAMASGVVSLLTGILCLCCVSSKRSSSALGFSVFMSVLAAVGAIASTAVTVMESLRISSDDPKHPCATPNPASINCSLWFDLQVAVAVLSGVNFILALTLMILVSMAMRRPKVREIYHERAVNVERRAASIRETLEPPEPEEIITAPVVVMMMENPAEVAQTPSSEEEEEEEEEKEEEEGQKESVGTSRGPFIEQLKMMSREELERRLGEHMQHQFLEDLRQELSRRNLIPINGRLASSTRSPNSSTTRRVSSQPVPAPKPDYYHEPLGYNKEERF